MGEVARLAGVSVGTVSNVLNGKGRVAERTRRRVLAAAEALCFAPNALIRSLQTGKTNTVGVFAWRLHLTSGRSIATELLRGISRGLSEQSLDGLIYGRHPHEGELAPSFFADGRVDGLILAPGGLSPTGVEALASVGLSTVLLYQRHVPPSMGAVTIDNASGVRAAVEHLVRLGHTRIAFIAPTNSDDFRERRAAYESAMEAFSRPVRRCWTPELASDQERDVVLAVMALARSQEPPTAIIAGNDGIALCALETLASLGARVPGDVSVVGFDDTEQSRVTRLTTIRQPAEEMGYTAAVFIGRLMSGADPLECRVCMPVEFLPRETTGPPSYS